MIIKVCGIRDLDNIRELSKLDIQWIGFIFYPGSPRYILEKNPDLISDLLSEIHYPFRKVGVFVNATPEEMMTTATRFNLDYLQLHGNETPDTCHTLRKRGHSIIKVFSVESEKDIEKVQEYEEKADYFLFDTKCSGYGGSGKRFDWSVLTAYQGKTPFLLSGGINPDSVEVIRNFGHPQLAGIDLNSGFEIAPAMKNIPLLSSFIKKIKK
ncbi:MAG: phosphoribosylanthranilate isomerase [Tannerellaceae bacterium]|nr:phosphoribosylanthranilate isomerase [Tannerellaceae bacterium]